MTIQRSVITLEGIGHGFLGRPVLDGVSLTLAAGEIVALVGPSGSGKTTILQIAAGLVEPLSGRVRGGYRRHAVVFQEPRLLPWMSARDNIAYGLRASGEPRRTRREKATRRARDVGLAAADLDKFPAEMSGGMRQRAAVARALAVDPDLVFFDEPFTAVDVGLKRSLQDLVIEAARREHFAALFVTHDLAEAARIAHRMIVLSARTLGIAVEIPVGAILGREIGERGDRPIFELVEAWSRDPLLAELFAGGREEEP